MVLGDNLHRKVVLLDIDIGIVAHGSHQSALYLGSCIVSMVQDAELRVSALTVQIEIAIALLVEVDTPVHQFTNLLGCHLYYLLHGFGVTDIVARNHRVFNMFLEVVEFEIGDRCHATLGKRGVSLIERCLTNHTHPTLVGASHLQGIAHTGYASSYHEEIVLVNHSFLSYTVQNYKLFLYFCKRNEEISVFTTIMVSFSAVFCTRLAAHQAGFPAGESDV